MTCFGLYESPFVQSLGLYPPPRVIDETELFAQPDRGGMCRIKVRITFPPRISKTIVRFLNNLLPSNDDCTRLSSDLILQFCRLITHLKNSHLRSRARPKDAQKSTAELRVIFPSQNHRGRRTDHTTFHTHLLLSRALGCRGKGLSSVLLGLEQGTDRLDWYSEHL